MQEPTALNEVELNKEDLLLLLQGSHEFFIEYFLAEEFYEGDYVQDFHILTFSRFVDLTQKKDVIALPRGHAKTTYLRLAFVYIMFFTHLRFLVYVSSDHGPAARSLKVIWEMVNSPEAQQAFGGVLKIERVAITEGFYEFDIEAYDRQLRPYRKRVVLFARGQGQTVRGTNVGKARPQYVGVDDVEDETAVKTKEGYAKMKDWFDNVLLRAIDKRNGKLAQIGNLIAKQTLLNDNLKDPDYRALRMGVLRKNGEPLWPTLWPKSDIAADLKSAIRRGQAGNWLGEMMNIPANFENGLLRQEQIPYTPRRSEDDGKEYSHFITIDPAQSQEEWADECAIVLHTIDGRGIGQQTEYVHRTGMSPSDIADTVADMLDRWGACPVGVESVQLQAILLDYLEVQLRLLGAPTVELVPLKMRNVAKVTRLKAYASALVDGTTTLAEGEFAITNQLLTYDVRVKDNKDDLIDAASMFSTMLRDYEHLVFAQTAEHNQRASSREMHRREDTTI